MFFECIFNLFIWLRISECHHELHAIGPRKGVFD